MIETQTAKGVHLVGGLKAPDAESAMRTAGRVLGRHLRAVTDRETGERSQWIWFQIGKLTSIDGIELIGTKHNPSGSGDQETLYNPDYAEFAVATECGMARIDERRADAPSLERLLELHARSAAPVR